MLQMYRFDWLFPNYITIYHTIWIQLILSIEFRMTLMNNFVFSAKIFIGFRHFGWQTDVDGHYKHFSLHLNELMNEAYDMEYFLV